MLGAAFTNLDLPATRPLRTGSTLPSCRLPPRRLARSRPVASVARSRSARRWPWPPAARCRRRLKPRWPARSPPAGRAPKPPQPAPAPPRSPPGGSGSTTRCRAAWSGRRWRPTPICWPPRQRCGRRGPCAMQQPQRCCPRWAARPRRSTTAPAAAAGASPAKPLLPGSTRAGSWISSAPTAAACAPARPPPSPAPPAWKRCASRSRPRRCWPTSACAAARRGSPSRSATSPASRRRCRSCNGACRPASSPRWKPNRRVLPWRKRARWCRRCTPRSARTRMRWRC